MLQKLASLLINILRKSLQYLNPSMLHRLNKIYQKILKIQLEKLKICSNIVCKLTVKNILSKLVELERPVNCHIHKVSRISKVFLNCTLW